MNRRELLTGGAAATFATLTASALAAEPKANAQAGHDHGHMHHHHHAGGADYATLAHAATHCVMFGEACIGHCLDLLAEGDKEMAACAKSVEQMLAACNMLRQLATWKSAYVPRMAAVVMDMCLACEQECRKHENKHKECRDCAESCAACAKECKAVAI